MHFHACFSQFQFASYFSPVISWSIRVQTREKSAVDLTSMTFPSFTRRYELPQPTANQKHDITSWTEAVDNSLAQLEHQAERYRSAHLCFSEKKLCHIRRCYTNTWKAVLLPQRYTYPIVVKDRKLNCIKITVNGTLNTFSFLQN